MSTIDAEFVDITPAKLPVVRMGKLPTTITPARINAATLPTVISAAQQAIARCTDLPQLLEYRDKAEGLAAAVRIMKNVGPDMVRKANEMMADAWRKGGELLSQYSNVATSVKGGRRGQIEPSARGKISRELGLDLRDATQMVRIYSAPEDIVYARVQKSRHLKRVAEGLPPADTRGYVSHGRQPYSDGLRAIMIPLTTGASGVKRVPLDKFSQLEPDERKVVKAKITEIMELLDEMDRLCK